ncbi:hypothetical protein F4604DRAFT_1688307 [Suillus subluteus]|nr:hypothetical protein F4604DRAFT_1688307 [Suillus subluteus]
MENAIQSFLQVSGVPPPDVARALLLRAKTRLAAGYRTFAQQDPANQDVKAIIQSEHLRLFSARSIYILRHRRNPPEPMTDTGVSMAVMMSRSSTPGTISEVQTSLPAFS